MFVRNAFFSANNPCGLVSTLYIRIPTKTFLGHNIFICHLFWDMLLMKAKMSSSSPLNLRHRSESLHPSPCIRSSRIFHCPHNRFLALAHILLCDHMLLYSHRRCQCFPHHAKGFGLSHNCGAGEVEEIGSCLRLCGFSGGCKKRRNSNKAGCNSKLTKHKAYISSIRKMQLDQSEKGERVKASSVEVKEAQM